MVMHARERKRKWKKDGTENKKKKITKKPGMAFFEVTWKNSITSNKSVKVQETVQ